MRSGWQCLRTEQADVDGAPMARARRRRAPRRAERIARPEEGILGSRGFKQREMARRIRQPLGRQYAYSPRAVALSQTRVGCSSVLEHSVPSRRDGPDSLELRLSSLEDKVGQLISLVESKLVRSTGESEDAAPIAYAPVAKTPPAMSPAAASLAGPPGPAIMMFHPCASQPVRQSQPAMPMAHPPVVWVHPGGTLPPGFYLSASGWPGSGWAAPAGMVMHPGAELTVIQPGLGSWSSVAHQSGTTRPRQADATARSKRSQRGAPMPVPPWEYNALRAAGEVPGPGHYSPHCNPENSSFNVRITPNPEHPGYGAYTARSLPPRCGAKAKAV